MVQPTALVPEYRLIAGIDLGDVNSHVCIIDSVTGNVVEETRLRTKPKDVSVYFGRHANLRVAVEAGTQSNWVSKLIIEAGHDVTVANAARVRLIHGGPRKNDRLDAEKLARLLRYDRDLLAPIQHRAFETQYDLAVLRSREALVEARVKLVNHVRGVSKSFGLRLPTCETYAFARRASEYVPPELTPALQAQLDTIAALTQQINLLDARVQEFCQQKYPASSCLTQVYGVGSLTALTFMLTIEDPRRFGRSRDVAAYLGLTPGERQSGSSDPTQRISKAGDRQLRRLLVQCAHHILRRNGIDSDLKRHGLKLARGGKEAKRKAVVAVARKLAVLLHSLWLTGEAYEPTRNSRR